MVISCAYIVDKNIAPPLEVYKVVDCEDRAAWALRNSLMLPCSREYVSGPKKREILKDYDLCGSWREIMERIAKVEIMGVSVVIIAGDAEKITVEAG